MEVGVIIATVTNLTHRQNLCRVDMGVLIVAKVRVYQTHQLAII